MLYDSAMKLIFGRVIALFYNQNMSFSGRPGCSGQLSYWSHLTTVYSCKEGNLILVVDVSRHQTRVSKDPMSVREN